ncbi:MAG: hypothetical protein AABY22_36495 [Nanoarchaeota archaeon]
MKLRLNKPKVEDLVSNAIDTVFHNQFELRLANPNDYVKRLRK